MVGQNFILLVLGVSLATLPLVFLKQSLEHHPLQIHFQLFQYLYQCLGAPAAYILVSEMLFKLYESNAEGDIIS